MIKNLISIIALFFIFPSLSFSQDTAPNLDNFVKGIFKYYRLPESIANDCKWNYGIMVLNTNSANEIIDVQFANEDEADDLRASFQFLKGYKLADSLNINQRPIVLFLTVEQLGGAGGCIKPEKNPTPSRAMKIILLHVADLLKKYPRSIVRFQPVTIYAGGRQS